jgi:hypothetical protein
LHIAGHAACFIALFAMLGGHWAVLQSVAWTRMLVTFSERDSLPTAMAKTFDGQHPCAMCLKIRAGRQQEEQRRKDAPSTRPEKMPDLILAASPVAADYMPSRLDDVMPLVPRLHPDFISTPLAPPPRGFSAAA